MAKVNGFTVWDEEFDSRHFTPEEIAARLKKDVADVKAAIQKYSMA